MATQHSTWNYPAPRNGWRGQWDRFIGPGATAVEQSLALVPALLAALALPLYAWLVDLNWTPVQYGVAAFLAFDMVGGVVTNATSSAKRWYHRSGQTAKQHLTFVAVHMVQIALVGGLFREMDLLFIGAVYASLLVSAVIVLKMPLRVQRSVALLLATASLILSEYVFSPTPGFEWFIPVLFIKLLVSHLTTEEPYV